MRVSIRSISRGSRHAQPGRRARSPARRAVCAPAHGDLGTLPATRADPDLWQVVPGAMPTSVGGAILPGRALHSRAAPTCPSTDLDRPG